MVKKYLRNEHGYALIIALLAITVITVLGLSVLATAGASKSNVDREEKDQSAYYIAEAGLNLKKAELQKIESLFTSFQAQQKAEEEKNKMTSAAFIAAFKAYADSELQQVVKPTNYVATTSQCDAGTVCKEVFELRAAKAAVQTKVDITANDFIYTVTSTGFVDKQKRKIQSTLSYHLDAKAYKEAVNSFSKYAIHAIDTLTINKGIVTGALGFAQQPKEITNVKFPFGTDSADSYISAPSKEIYKGCKPSNQHICDNSYLSAAEAKGDIVFNDTALPTIPEFPVDEFPIDTTKYWDKKIPNTAKKISTDTLNGDYELNVSDLSKINHTIDIGENNVNLFFTSDLVLTNNVKFN
ncbi:MAG: pilus assembly PilX N-terminal domain-containing protein, partial [Kurthia sp.]|nr:pilus assembly PilX N-terminal domain-containing protein [Candidatus Kurthia equi]